MRPAAFMAAETADAHPDDAVRGLQTPQVIAMDREQNSWNVVLLKVIVCRERLKVRFGHQIVKRYFPLLLPSKIAVCADCRVTENSSAKGGKGIFDMLHELFRIPHFFITPFLPSRGLLQQTPMRHKAT